jgi:tetratricopeptide (TPR) repeat protein
MMLVATDSCMARDDWFRRITWTERDREDFFARNKRSRGKHSKAQYMRIQAHTLLGTGKPQLIGNALELAKQACSEYPGAMDTALTLEIAGECCEKLERPDNAIDYYRRAIAREHEFRGVRSNAPFLLGKLVVEQRRKDCYGEALNAMEAHGAPVFPWHGYILNGVRAMAATEEGRLAEAKAFAREALAASAIRDTGLSHGRGHLGTVRETNTGFHFVLLRIAGA